MSIPKIRHRVVAKTAAYQIDAVKDRSGTIFTNRGAAGTVVFTLPPNPTKFPGHEYTFVGVTALQNITVQTKVADTLLVLNDVAADSLTLSTAGQLIGGVIRVVNDGTQWIAWTDAVGVTGTVAT